jgi:hypothetical protein
MHRLLFFVLFAALLASFAIDHGLPSPRRAPPTIDVMASARRADELAIEDEMLGGALLQVLTDEKQPTAARSRAARALGDLRHAPAIPEFIKLIKLNSPPSRTGFFEPPAITDRHPCVAALIDCRMEAVPQLLDAYFYYENDRDQDRWELIGFALDVRIGKEISIYAQGLAFDKNDEILKQSVVLLMRWFLAEDRRVTLPPEWFKP